MEKINILFCSDFATWLRWNNIKPNISIFGNILDYVKESDLAFVNLESPATNVGKPILKDGPNVKTTPEWLKPIKEAGFNLLGLANNHIGDYGEEAVIDCIENCKRQGFNTVGAGKDLKESQKIYYFEKNNIKVAIIAVCQHEYGIAEDNKAGVAPLDPIDNIKQIQEAKNNADFVIICIHSGNEFFSYPRPYFRKQCQFYIEQGCDAIICHHSHVPGAYEVYNGKPIFYSLGNFLFDISKSPNGWNEGYMVKLELNTNHNQIKFELIPYTQSFEQGGIKLMTDSEKESFLNRIEGYRNILADKEKYKKVWNDFCESKKLNYLMTQYCPVIIRGLARIIERIGVSKILLNNIKRLALRLNHIRCESHREVFLEILNNELTKRYR